MSAIEEVLKKDSNWRKILDYFASATQIGMTATPKENQVRFQYRLFWRTCLYSLREGIEDGFLAPFKVINITTDISEGWRPKKASGIYMVTKSNIEFILTAILTIPLFLRTAFNRWLLKSPSTLKVRTGWPETIVFCATEDAVERMRMALSQSQCRYGEAEPGLCGTYYRK